MIESEYNRPLFSRFGAIIKSPSLLWDRSGAHPYLMYDKDGNEITVADSNIILFILADGQKFVTSDGNYLAVG